MPVAQNRLLSWYSPRLHLSAADVRRPPAYRLSSGRHYANRPAKRCVRAEKSRFRFSEKQRAGTAPGRIPSGSGCYEIRVRNHIDLAWLEHFGGMSISHEGEDVSVPTGVVADQAALHGLLARIRDLGLPLLSLRWLEGRDLSAP